MKNGYLFWLELFKYYIRNKYISNTLKSLMTHSWTTKLFCFVFYVLS